MAPITRNPETLTVQQLKTELQKKKVSIPVRAKKDVYVDLYRKHILRESAGFGFSSDEDEPPRSTRKVTVRRSQVYQSSSSGVSYLGISKCDYGLLKYVFDIIVISFKFFRSYS